MGRPKGSRNKQGGTYTATTSGYVFVRQPGHPNADTRGYVREHVLVMSQHLGRPMIEGEVVHHINGIRNDNRLENLQVMTQNTHTKHHHVGTYKPQSLKNLRGHTSEEMRHIWDTTRAHEREKPKTCDNCGKEYFRKGTQVHRPNHAHQYCSRDCYVVHSFSGAVERRKAVPYEMHPNSLKNLQPPPRKPLKVCDHCGSEFYRRGTPKHEHAYCSVQCASAHRFPMP